MTWALIAGCGLGLLAHFAAVIWYLQEDSPPDLTSSSNSGRHIGTRGDRPREREERE